VNLIGLEIKKNIIQLYSNMVVAYINIEQKTLKNKNYRKVIYTDKKQQVVLMCLVPGEFLPEETHKGTQFFRVESGNGTAIIGKKKLKLRDGIVVVVPANTKHYIENTSRKSNLLMYTIYSPPQHKPGTINKRQPDM
jgi:mannose-6-phosphate isomerase-like protein (cupin superfamily)